MQVTQHVHQVPVSTPTLFPASTTNVYIVTDGPHAVLIDAGYAHRSSYETVMSYLQEIGSPQVEAILLTHFHQDHAPGAVYHNVPILTHPLEVPYVEREIAPVEVSGTLEQGDTYRVGTLELHVFHAPGHTPGGLHFWLPADEVLFTGDNIVSVGTTWIGPPEGNLRDYLETLNAMQKIPAKWVAPGHGAMIADVQEKIEFFINRRLEREAQILDLLRARPFQESELLTSVYGGTVHPSVMWVAERTIRGHLIKLLEDGQIQEAAGWYAIRS